MPYKLGPDGKPSDASTDCALLIKKLEEARGSAPDSPLYQLLHDYPAIAHEKTDVFRDRVVYSETMKKRLSEARRMKQGGREALRAIENELEPIEDEEAGVIIDLFLSYRAVKAWPEMIALVPKMTPPLRDSVMVQEQLGLALNRNKQPELAEQTLKAVIERHGPSSETYGILGRVYKDRWDAAKLTGDLLLAEGFLDAAIASYRRGFEADWRDAYPGVNVVTLMELKDPPDPERLKLLPVVRYSVERRIKAGMPDYWDHATQLELAVLAKDKEGAQTAIIAALVAVRETWEPETTLNNLRLIRETREKRGDMVNWAKTLEDALAKRISDFTR